MLVDADDPWMESTMLRADVALVDGAPELGPRTRVRLHLGTADVGARLVAQGRPVTPGARIPVRLSLDAPVVARAGDRFVLRASSPAMTIGGGEVTDPAPAGRRVRPWASAGAPAAVRLDWIVQEGGGAGVERALLPIRIGARPTEIAALVESAPTAVAVGDRLYARALVESLTARVLDTVRATHRARPLEPGASVQSLRDATGAGAALLDFVLGQLVRSKSVNLADGIVSLAGWAAAESAGDRERVAAILGALTRAGPQPPSVDELTAQFGPGTLAALKLLARRGDAVAVVSDRYYAAAALASLIAVVRSALQNGASATASELREKTGLTRKYLIPFLEYCDRSGVTVRRGDSRVLPASR